MKKVTVIGGGTGTFVALTGLKKFPIDLAVVVSMMDSGGSTGRLRDQLGVLPPGDVRQCLVALAQTSDLWRQLFLYRFENGDLAGHNFGNIMLSALEKVTSDYQQVIDTASQILQTQGQVLPVTFAPAKLCASYADGRVLTGEGIIDEQTNFANKIEEVYLDPPVKATDRAVKRLLDSDLIVIGPGDLFTSIIPVMLVGGIKEALQKTPAKIIFVLNLMTKIGQTSGLTGLDHVNQIIKYMGKKPNIVLQNNAKIPLDILSWYQQNQEKTVTLDPGQIDQVQIQSLDLIDTSPTRQNQADALTRSILRHHPNKLAKAIFDLL